MKGIYEQHSYGFKCLYTAQPKQELENLVSTTVYTWDLGKPIHLAPLDEDTTQSLSLGKLTGLDARTMLTHFIAYNHDLGA